MTATSSRAARGSGFWSSTRTKRMIPIAFVTYSLAYLDRSNYSIGSAGGMADDLNMSSGMDALVAASFFLGYFFFQIPGTIYAERRSAAASSRTRPSPGACSPPSKACCTARPCWWPSASCSAWSRARSCRPW